ncbi:MAG: acetamidase/formamidase family protein [Firmicutes bacterium]|nr:acetamidase/formamidase family protein [Bacillota bacterium]
MIHITTDHLTRALGRDDSPAAYMDPGGTAVFDTLDCYSNALLPEGSTFEDVNSDLNNPATGPLYINGAEPGDMLKIRIDRIQLGRVGILDRGNNPGAFKGMFDHRVLNRIRVKDGMCIYKDRFTMPVSPMIGVIGTAPAGEPVSTRTPKDHGGNMDCTRVEEGATLYLPVSVPGGLLSMGDLHAVMGEGEVGNCGVEIEGKVTVTVDVEKDLGLTFPMIENERQWMTIAYGDDLDEAARKSVEQLHLFLVKCCGLDPDDACMLMDMAADMIVCQIVNPCKTVRMEISKELIEKMRML